MEKEPEKNEDDISIDLKEIWPFKKKKEEKSKEHEDKPVETAEIKPSEEPVSAEHKTHHEHKQHHEKKEEHETKKHHEDDQKEADEDISIDFSKIFGKKKEHKKETVHEQKEDETEEPEIDLKDIGGKIKGLFKGTEEAKGKEDDEVGIDTKAISSFISSKKGLIIPLILILFSIYMTVSIRMLPADMSYTEDWARQSIYSVIRSDIGTVVNAQYPNLPDERKSQLIDEEFTKAIQSNSYVFKTGQYQGQGINIDQQVKGSADNFKGFFKDSNGNMYMPDIDPYYWYRYARNILDHGYPGDTIVNGKSYDTFQLAPNGREIAPEDTFHPYTIAILFRALNIFNPNTTLMHAEMLYPVIISAIITLLIFLITRRIAGDIAGLFAGIMVAINPSFLSRSLFGHGDSDTWVLFFSVLAAFLFLEAMESKHTRWKALLAALGGITIGFYARFWGGWWYVFDFLISTSLIYAAYLIISNRSRLSNINELFNNEMKGLVFTVSLFVLASGASVLLLSGPGYLTQPIEGLGFTRIKEPVMASLWPNVLTTVAELNEGDINGIINNVGGIAIFYLGLLGIMLTMAKKRIDTTDIVFLIGSAIWWLMLLIIKNDVQQLWFLVLLSIPIAARVAYAAIKSERIDMKLAALLIIWFIVTIYASTKGIRFVMLLAPALSIAFGVSIGYIYKLIKWLAGLLGVERKVATGASLLVIASLIVFMLFLPASLGDTAKSIARQDMPMINDAWYNSLTAIRDNSSKNAIITSWWDFGHHFKALAERPVTFDGTTQGSPQAHWVGQILRTDNEDLAVGILRMLDCGGNNAFEEVQKTDDNDTLKSVQILYSIFEKDRDEADSILKEKYQMTDEQSENVLKLTHCDPPEAFFIASEDMVGKSGVWGHFGSWNFERAYIWQNLRPKTQEEAISEMTSKFNYTNEQAEQIYYDIQAMNDAEGNSWVSPWPSYAMDGPTQRYRWYCDSNAGIATCNVPVFTPNRELSVTINSNSKDIYIETNEGRKYFRSATFMNEKGTETKQYHENVAIDLAATAVPEGSGYSILFSAPELNASMFSRMLMMDGHSLRHFRLLTYQQSITGAEIFVYKVDWDGGEPNIKQELVKKEKISPGDHVSFNYIGYIENGSIFDSSIHNWMTRNITKDEKFSENSSPFTFTMGNQEIIPGLEEAFIGLKKGEEKIVKITPEKAYGTDPALHPLGNKTLYFKIRIESIK